MLHRARPYTSIATLTIVLVPAIVGSPHVSAAAAAGRYAPWRTSQTAPAPYSASVAPTHVERQTHRDATCVTQTQITTDLYPQLSDTDQRLNKTVVANYGDYSPTNPHPLNPGSISIIDGRSNTVVGTIRDNVAQPAGVAIDQRRHLAFVTSSGNNRVIVVDLKSRVEVASFTSPLFSGPFGITYAYAKEAGRGYVTNLQSNIVAQFTYDAEAQSAVVTQVPDPTGLFQTPQDLAFDAATDKVYVANNKGNNVVTIAVAPGEPADNALGVVADPNHTITAPTSIGVSPRLGRVFVTNPSDESFTVIDTAKNGDSAVARVPEQGGTYPFIVRVNDRTGAVVIANNGDDGLGTTVSVYDGESLRLVTVLGGFNGPEGLTFYKDKALYVSNDNLSTVTKVTRGADECGSDQEH